jgi:hypothetical protein
MAKNNTFWGEERIANGLLLKVGIRVSPRTVRKYMPKNPPGRPRSNQRWSTFVRNHAAAILACDFCVVVTATFRLIFVFIVIEHQTRRIVHCNFTTHPTLPPGHDSNYAKPYPLIIVIVSSSMTVIVFSRSSLTSRFQTWEFIS